MELNNYKNYIINFHKYGYIEKNYNKRKRTIERKYTDEFLQNVIENTQDFLIYLLNMIKNNSKEYYDFFFYRIELAHFNNNEYIKCINNNCVANIPCDELFLYNGKYISKFLLKDFFGSDINIEIELEDNDFYDPYVDQKKDERKLCVYVQGSVNKFNQILNNNNNNNNLIKQYKK